ncbi:MAG: hypothetical protein V4599_14340 [Verrucomicrobiota bacterium]
MIKHRHFCTGTLSLSLAVLGLTGCGKDKDAAQTAAPKAAPAKTAEGTSSAPPAPPPVPAPHVPGDAFPQTPPTPASLAQDAAHDQKKALLAKMSDEELTRQFLGATDMDWHDTLAEMESRGTPEVIATLARNLDSARGVVRQGGETLMAPELAFASARVLSKYGEKAVPELVKTVASDSQSLRNRVIAARLIYAVQKTQGDGAYVQNLRQSLGSENEVRLFNQAYEIATQPQLLSTIFPADAIQLPSGGR